MMDESVQHRDHRLSSLDRRGDERGGAVRLSGTVWAPSVLPFDCVAQYDRPYGRHRMRRSRDGRRLAPRRGISRC